VRDLTQNDARRLLDQAIEELHRLKTGFSSELETLDGLKNQLWEGRFHSIPQTA